MIFICNLNCRDSVQISDQSVHGIISFFLLLILFAVLSLGKRLRARQRHLSNAEISFLVKVSFPPFQREYTHLSEGARSSAMQIFVIFRYLSRIAIIVPVEHPEDPPEGFRRYLPPYS